ncbi:MAG: glycosyltransferase family 39 protein, partial [bacterium]|nr:glycosyltransferase family 39 protein [bacterium]
MDPYGFNVNWYGVEMPMYEITKNPPLTSYYLALISLFIGWSEVAMHLAMIIPALAVIWGTYRLSAKLAPSPLIAALSTLLTPVFLLSATTIMSDIIMSALWVWAVVLWLEGMDKEKQYLLLLSGIIIAAAIFAKYYAVSLVPLLSIYSIMRKGYDIRK